MSIFDRKSRYARYAEVLTAVDERGRTVNWVAPAQIPAQRLLGEHRRKSNHRLDRLAAHYLDDPLGFWRIATLNDGMTADAIADTPLVKIPTKDS